MVYNVSYDLHDPGQKYKELHELIVSVSNNRWAHILDSTYIIESNKTSEEIHLALSKALDSNDNILVCEINKNYHGYLKKKYWQYIKGLF
ncbi:hypothetical protein [Clostridium beijerinckii]|uniref:hypothetical protein n=1 Tax=Clostridium beijerinckii TaxID=1520 RepID=UPI00232ACBD6|nr:hypothetical protein [Clostridium beijerinckii]